MAAQTLLHLQQYFTTQLAVVGGIDATQTDSIVIQSTTGLDTTVPGIALLEYSDPLGDNYEWIEYKSINSTTKEFVGVIRGAEGGSGKTHDNGVIVAFPISESHVNRLAAALSIGGVATNGVETTLDEDDMASDSATALVTQQSVKAYVEQFPKNSLYRQAIINGNFDVWQRGTSFVNPINTQYLADRWFLGLVSSAWAATASQKAFTVGQTDVPNNPKFYLELNITTSTTTYVAISQRIENVRTFSGTTCTLSFWAKVASGTIAVAPNLIQNFGSGGTPSTPVTTAGTGKTLTTSWQKFTQTFTLPSIAGKTLGTNGDDSIQVQFILPNSTVTTIHLAQVQLNEGSVALPFMPKSFEEELTACKRYYEKSYPYSVAPGNAFETVEKNIGSSKNPLFYYGQGTANTNRKHAYQRFQVEKRAIPAITYYDLAGTASRVTSIDANGALVSDGITETYQDGGGDTNGVYVQTAANLVGFIAHWTAKSEL